MHLKRWVTSIVLLPVLVLLILKGSSFLFAMFVCIISFLALWEYFRITSGTGNRRMQNGFLLFGFIMCPVIMWAAYEKSFKIILGIIVFNLIFSSLISLYHYKSDSSAPETVIKQVFGIIYIPVFLSCLVFIRNTADGVIWIFALLSIIFAGDTGAYYIGTYFGKNKLCPAVSPGKTIEGSVGGLAANLGIGAILQYFFLPLHSWIAGIFFFIFIGVAGQIGDLFESELKRSANIKDSGTILPGHGGMLDRIDALLFAAPVAFFFKEYIF